MRRRFNVLVLRYTGWYVDERITNSGVYSEPRPDRWCISRYSNDQLYGRRNRLRIYSSSYSKHIARRDRRYTERVFRPDEHPDELEHRR